MCFRLKRLLALFSIFIAVGAKIYFEPGGASISGGTKRTITGTCWQGELCRHFCLTNNETARYVGSINSVPVCCPFCESRGLYLSSRECNCRNPSYELTAEELREVEEFKRQLTGTAFTVHLTGGSVIFMTMLLNALTQYTIY